MKHIARLFLALTVASLLLIGPAAAHVRTASTKLSLKAEDTTVHKGDQVVLTAHLKSDWKKCYSNRRVKLFRYGTKVSYDSTNSQGIAVFKFDAQYTAKWQVQFTGRQWGTHPHSHTCLASQSQTIKIVVKK